MERTQYEIKTNTQTNRKYPHIIEHESISTLWLAGGCAEAAAKADHAGMFIDRIRYWLKLYGLIYFISDEMWNVFTT